MTSRSSPPQIDLSHIPAYHFILVKNAICESDTSGDKLYGEVLRVGEKPFLPEDRPVYPRDEIQRATLSHVWGIDDETDFLEEDFEWRVAPYELDEDDSDFEVFGESRTLFWICPPDLQGAMDFLIGLIQSGTDLGEIHFQYRERLFCSGACDQLEDECSFYSMLVEKMDERLLEIDPAYAKDLNFLEDQCSK